MADLILFGAGASFGAGAIIPEPPPLGNRLFSELVKNFPSSWGNLPSDITASFREHFENGMARLWTNLPTAIPLLMQHLTLYLVQFRPLSNGRCLYFRLIKWANKERKFSEIYLSTLNYDLILEYCIYSQGIEIDYAPGSLTEKFATVLKLHGSCNFLLQDVSASRGISFAGVSFDGKIQIVSPSQAIEYCLGNSALYPAMALYMSPKNVQIAPSQIRAIQEGWKQAVLEAQRVLVIGVHPYPQDSHVWGPLAETEAKLGYIGAEKAFQDWVVGYRKKWESEFLGHSWLGSFDSTLEFLSG